jgi:hypothetical protein
MTNPVSGSDAWDMTPVNAVDNDGGHEAVEVSGDVQLTAGYHAIRVDYFQSLWAKSLVVKMNGTPVADDALARWVDVTSVITRPSLARVVRCGSVPVALYDLRGKRIGEFADKAIAMRELQLKCGMGIAIVRAQYKHLGAESAAKLIVRYLCAWLCTLGKFNGRLPPPAAAMAMRALACT